MKNFKILVTQSKEVTELKKIIDIYEDIAATKLRQIKTDIIATREYYDGLRFISLEVGSDFQSALSKEKQKEATLFIAANQGFYGEIIQKTFKLFLDYVRAHTADNFVSGTLGMELVKQYAKGIRVTGIPFVEDEAGSESVSKILETLVSYHKITVFYGKFQNLVIQEPHEGVVSGKMFPQEKEDLKALARKRMNYLYEPALYPVSEVFTSTIFKGVLTQMMLEAQLARVASRVMHLDQALDKTDELLKKLSEEKHKAKKRILEKKQNEMTAKLLRRKNVTIQSC